MEKIKIASKFLTKAQASKQATKERQLLKSQGKNKTHRVEVLFAYDFWRTNRWFNQKKFGLKNPTDQDYIIIITEVSKPNTINMLANTQKSIQSPNRSSSDQHNTQKSKTKGAAPVRTHKSKTRYPGQARDLTTGTYTILNIPVPYFYRSVA